MEKMKLYFYGIDKVSYKSFITIEKLLHGNESKGLQRFKLISLFEVLSISLIEDIKDVFGLKNLGIRNTWGLLGSSEFFKLNAVLYKFVLNFRPSFFLYLSLLPGLVLEKKRLTTFKNIFSNKEDTKDLVKWENKDLAFTKSSSWILLHDNVATYLRSLNLHKPLPEVSYKLGLEKKDLYLRKIAIKKLKVKTEKKSLKWLVFIWERFLLSLRAHLISRGKRNRLLYEAYITSIKKGLRDIKDFVYILAFFIPKVGLNTVNVGRKSLNILRYKTLKKQLQLLMKWFLLHLKGKGRTRGIDVNSLHDLENILNKAVEMKREYTKDLRLNISKKTFRKSKNLEKGLTEWDKKQEQKVRELRYLNRSSSYEKLDVYKEGFNQLESKRILVWDEKKIR